MCWFIDTGDSLPEATSESILDQVRSHLSKGAIILLHTTQVEAETLDQLLTLIEQQGYQMGTLTEALS